MTRHSRFVVDIGDLEVTRPLVSIGVYVRGDNDMTVADLWPDGNAPDPVTAADVVQLIRSCGGVRRVLTEWNLDHDIEVIVRDGDGSHTSGICR